MNTSDREALAAALLAWEGTLRAGDYIALQAYLAPSGEVTESLQRSRAKLRDRHRAATTLGYGPRFLHSTGQLHKGGSGSGVFLQIVDDPAEEIPVPGTDFGFGRLITAQARGDLAALLDRGRRVLRVNLGTDAVQGLSVLEEAIGSSSA